MKHRVPPHKIPTSNTGKLIEVQEHEIALFNIGGHFYAVDDECPHAGWRLSEGELTGSVVTCLLHGAKFDVRNGRCVGGFTCADVQCYSVEEKDGALYIELV